MVQTLHPGVYIIEEPAAPSMTGVSATTAGFVGIAQKGPTTAQLITSFTRFQDQFGDFFKLGGSYTYLAFAVQAFFNEGGSACYVSRTIPTDAAVASKKIWASDQIDVTGTVRSLNKGAWGNQIAIRSSKITPMVVQNEDMSPGKAWDGTVEVDQAKGLEIGDLVYIETLTTGESGPDEQLLNPLVVYSINTSGTNPVITFTDSTMMSPLDAPLETGSKLHTSTTHRFRAQLTNNLTALTSGVTHIDVPKGSSSGVVQGQLLSVLGDGTGGRNHAFGLVDNVVAMASFDRIFLTSAGLVAGNGAGTTITADSNAWVTSVEFDITVFESSKVVETHRFLSMSANNARDFVGGGLTGTSSPATGQSTFRDGRLYGASNQSNRIEFITQHAVNSGTAVIMAEGTPLTITDRTPTGGSDGTSAAISNAVWRDAINLFRDIEDISMFAAPDAAGSVTQSKAMVTHAELNKISVAVLDPSLANSEGAGSVEDVLSYRSAELNIDSSYAAMYWPWLVVADPKASAFNVQDPGAFSQGFGTATVKVPPSGHVLGEWARTVFDRGVHKAPANVTLTGVLDVTRRISDSDHDFLNPRGINAIRFFPGQGIRIFGARTLFSTPNGKHYVNVRRLLIFIERSLAEGNRFAVFEPNDPSLYTQLKLVNEGFLTNLWEEGALFPSNDKARAFFVKVDEETTTAADRKNGRVNVLIGINPPYPAEFVVFRVSLFDGTSSVQQVTTGTV